MLLGSALISGAIAGLGGAIQVMGVSHELSQEVSSSYGYTGIVVATLGALSAIGVVLVALLLGDITVGAQNASLVLQLPPQMGQVVSALLMLAVLSVLVLRRYKISWRRPRATDTDNGSVVTPTDAEPSDAGPPDAGPSDAGPPDTKPPDPAGPSRATAPTSRNPQCDREETL